MSVLEDKELEKRWVAALRSGEYKQAKGSLRDEDGFCCLGVLCDIQRDELGGTWRPSGSFSVGKEVFYAGALEVPNGPTNPVSGLLADLNDTGESFEEIADCIEGYS